MPIEKNPYTELTLLESAGRLLDKSWQGVQFVKDKAPLGINAFSYAVARVTRNLNTEFQAFLQEQGQQGEVWTKSDNLLVSSSGWCMQQLVKAGPLMTEATEMTARLWEDIPNQTRY